MSLAEEYRRQLAWRDWPTALGQLPPLDGTHVLDLGCGAGDVAAELVTRGACVVGIDADAELLAAARARGLNGAEFRPGDARAPQVPEGSFDGLWASFLPAYFVELAPVLAGWARLLRPGGWMALTEVDDLFANEPLEPWAHACLEAYVAEARGAGRYDFRMGRRLRESLERAGLHVTQELELADREFAFAGPARPEVLAAWEERFARMGGLQRSLAADFARLRAAFLACLAHPGHRARSRVLFCLARTAPGKEGPHPAPRSAAAGGP